MKHTTSIVTALAAYLIAASAIADDFDFELGLSIGRNNSYIAKPELFTGTVTLPASSQSSVSEQINLAGVWYYSGFSDATGPKSQAAFLSRASGISLVYSYSDDSSLLRSMGGGGFAPSNWSTDGRTDALSANFRNVWRDSGWYVLAGVGRVESEEEGKVNDINFFGGFESTAYTLGAGKYFGQATAVDLSVTEEDYGLTSVDLSFSHIGSIGNDWQYGADIGLAKSDQSGDDGSYSLRGSLYPSPKFEFGMEWSRQHHRLGFDMDSVEGFASWFARDHVEITARYQQDSPDTLPGWDIDDDEFSIGVNVRF
jgi:hypothetical protein